MYQYWLSIQGPPIPLYEPLESGVNDNIFISKSYDATSHFETTTDDVKDIYRRAEGHELVVEGLREGTNLVGGEWSFNGTEDEFFALLHNDSSKQSNHS